jgi:hypothetical protein
MLLILFECFQTSHQGLLFSMVSNHKNDIWVASPYYIINLREIIFEY